MKKVIIITGASSGFGSLTARALAKAGHIERCLDVKRKRASDAEFAYGWQAGVKIIS